MPDERDIPKLPRQWIINVIYSIVGDDLREWVSQQIKSRNEKLAEKQDLMIDLDPDIAAAFGSSLNISSKCLAVCIIALITNRHYVFVCSNQGSWCSHPQVWQQAKEATSGDA